MELHWAYKHIRQVEHDAKAKNVCDSTKLIYIADCTQIYLGEIIILFDDICCSDYWPLSTTITCSSTSPLLGGGARINNT